MRLGGAIGWMGLGQGSAVLLQFGASVVLARLLTPYDMGIFALAGATVALLGLIQAFGLQALLVREEELTDGVIATAFTVNTALALLLSAAVLLVSMAGAAWLHEDGVRRVMAVLAINPLIGAFDFLPAALLEREGRFRVLSLAGIAGSVAAAGVTIGAALLGAGYMSAAWAGLASAGSYALLVNVAGRRHASFRLGVSEWRRVTGFGAQMFATAGLHAIGGRVSDLLLGRFQGLTGLGLYSRAASLNGLLWNNIHLAVGRVMLVDFADLNRRGESLRERYLATVEVATAILWPAFTGFGLLSGPIIALLYGERWTSAALPAALLAASSVVLVAITMTWEVFAATGNIAAQTRIEFANAVVTTALFLLGSWFGLAAAAGSRIVAALVGLALYWPHLNRMTDTRTADLLPIYARSAALTLLATAPALAAMLARGFRPDLGVVGLVTVVVAGAVLWAGGLVVLRHPLGRTLRARLRREGPPALAAVAPMGVAATDRYADVP